jgi:hypothetical protein
MATHVGVGLMLSNYALYRTGLDKVASPWLLCPVDKRER